MEKNKESEIVYKLYIRNFHMKKIFLSNTNKSMCLQKVLLKVLLTNVRKRMKISEIHDRYMPKWHGLSQTHRVFSISIIHSPD